MFRPTRLWSALAPLLALTLASPAALARPGDVDKTFGTEGRVALRIGDEILAAAGTAVQEDGKIVVVGTVQKDDYYDIAVWRLNTDGSLDKSFGDAGRVITDLGAAVDTATAVAIQPDGKIVVAGSTGDGLPENTTTVISDFALLRYLDDGRLDTSFGAGGRIITQAGTGVDVATAVGIQADGKLLVSGWARNGTHNDFAVARYTVNGGLDAGFGTKGITLVDFSKSDDQAYGLALQPDGGIVLAGFTETKNGYDTALVRLTAEGKGDSKFGKSGKATLALVAKGDDAASSVVLLPDNKILVGGAAQVGQFNDAMLARVKQDGTLDTQFGVNGIALLDLAEAGQNTNDTILTMALQPDGKIIAGGSREKISITKDKDDNEIITVVGRDSALIAFNPTGTFYTGFGTAGVVKFDLGVGDNGVDGLALQEDGGIVATGTTAEVDAAVMRFEGEAFLTEPVTFEFISPTDKVELSSVQTSNIVQIDGLDPGVYVPLRITDGEYALNGAKTYSSLAAWVTNGDQINVRHTAAKTYATTVTTLLSVGGVALSNNLALVRGEMTSAEFSSTTIDEPPPPTPAPTPTPTPSPDEGGGGTFGLFAALALLPLLARRRRRLPV